MLGEQLGDKPRMESVTRAIGGDPTLDVASREGQIPHEVEHLMADTFVGEAERVPHHSLRAKHQQIGVRDALAESSRAKLCGLLFQ